MALLSANPRSTNPFLAIPSAVVLYMVRSPLLLVSLALASAAWVVALPLRLMRRGAVPAYADIMSYVAVLDVSLATHTILRPLFVPSPWPRWPQAGQRFEPRLSLFDLP
jgi:hypothetical protein